MSSFKKKKFKVTLQISLKNQETDCPQFQSFWKRYFLSSNGFKILFSKEFKTSWRRKLQCFHLEFPYLSKGTNVAFLFPEFFFK